MTPMGTGLLLIAAVGIVVWILDLVRRGQLYVGYGVVLLGLVASLVGVATLRPARDLVVSVLESVYPREPAAVAGLTAALLLVIYVLHQLSVLSHRVATLTQEIALRGARRDDEGKR